jgi:dihydrofolate reductase
MSGPFRIEGYAIVSVDGMIADSTGLMPNSLKFEADQRLYEQALDRADVLVHGQLSYEWQANSPKRRRLIVTRRSAGVEADPDNPNARFWNPSGASVEAACASLGVDEGLIAVIGGTFVFSLFLKIGYDVFSLSRTDQVRLPGGVPVFAESRSGRSPEEILAAAGLEPGPVETLGEGLTMVEWTRIPRGPAG